MKKLFIIAIILIVSNLIYAQDTNKTIKVGKYSLSEATITSGKGPLTSGLDTRFDFSNGKNGVLFLQANSDRATIHFGRKFGNFKLLESFGVYKNMIWTGPMLLYKLGPLDFMVWNGVIFAKTDLLEVSGFNPQFFMSYESIGLTFFKNNRIGGSILYFGQTPMNWFVSYKRTINIGEKSKLFAEVTYNRNLDIPMFVIGYTMKFQ